MNHNHVNFSLLALVLILVVLIVCPLTMYATGPQLAQIAVDNASRPQSPTDLIMMSRSTAPASTSQGIGAAGWFAVVLVLSAAVIGILYFGSQALRQWRLAKGKQRHSPAPVPMRQIYDIPQLPMARPAPRVPVLPDGGQNDQYS